ncbi:MAG: hypothetical protein R3C42_08425 [Parvularculaceae bacterium]|nr:hypothetical protein [Parvularculaceae bacterium]
MGKSIFKCVAAAAAAAMAFSAFAAAQTHENGYGPDPDGDTNPATMTRAVANIGATDVLLDPRFTVVTFEPPPGSHDRPVRNSLVKRYGVRFSKGLRWQICDDQRYYQYDSLCTYIRPPSGSYAAYYRDDLSRPLNVTFEKKPVCGVVLSVYPPGGKEGEIFEVTLDAKNADGSSAGSTHVRFAWTQNTFRWRVMAGGFFLSDAASSMDISVARAKDQGPVYQFLIDDLAYVSEDCEEVFKSIRDVAGFVVSDNGDIEAAP